MTDDAIAQSSPASLAVLSLSAPGDSQPDFDENAALINAASAEDSSFDEVVLLRLLVFRRSHPNAIVRTHLERFDDGQVVVQAEIILASGAATSAHAIAEGGVAGIEQAEHRALGRALEFLGEAILVSVTTQDDAPDVPQDDRHTKASLAHIDTPADVTLDLDAWDDDDTFVGDDATPSREADPEPEPLREIPPPRFSSTPPRERPNSRDRDLRPHRETQESPPDEEQDPAPPPAVVDAVRRANLRRHGVGHGERSQVEPAPDFQEPAPIASSYPESGQDDAPLENYSWTAFWRVARPQGLDKIKVEQIIGEPITPLTPLQVREKLKAAGYDL